MMIHQFKPVCIALFISSQALLFSAHAEMVNSPVGGPSGTFIGTIAPPIDTRADLAPGMGVGTSASGGIGNDTVSTGIPVSGDTYLAVRANNVAEGSGNGTGEGAAGLNPKYAQQEQRETQRAAFAPFLTIALSILVIGFGAYYWATRKRINGIEEA